MSYNTDLQNNNIELQAILATINALPEAGSSSSDEYTIYSSATEPTQAQEGDIWIDYSAEIQGGGLPSVITAGDTPVLAASKFAAPATSTSSYTDVGIQITIAIAGTYRFRWMAVGGGSSSYAARTRLYKNNTAVGSEHSTTAKGAECTEDLACSAGDTISLRLRGYSYAGTYGSAGGLIACINWDNGMGGN